MTHKTSRHTICDINQRRSSKATASRFQWRPDLLWGGECRQEARGGATPGRTLLRVCASGSGRIHEHTSSIIPPNANVKNQRETLGNLAAGELVAGMVPHSGPWRGRSSISTALAPGLRAMAWISILIAASAHRCD